MKIENSFNPIDMAVSGLKAQRKNMELISSNIANMKTSDAGDGNPYRRLEAVFSTDDSGSVAVTDVIKDMSDFQKMLAKPGDPRADADGYIRMPNVSLPHEIMSMNLASRNYQANAAVLKRYQKMVETALELLR